LLAVLLEIPRTIDQWNRFAWHHRSSHDAIRLAILQRKGINLPQYQLDPIDPGHFGDFLQSNSQSHIDMLGVLGIQGEDLQDVDVRQENQLVAWTALHYLEHYNAERALGI
jgi:hypothetical protein